MANQRGGQKNRKIGRAARKPKNAKYRNNGIREKNKVKRILQSSGSDEAFRYASRENLQGYLLRLERGRKTRKVQVKA